VTGVYFAHARLYDADLGRMLSRDPVKRGLNGYPYCGNDPVNHTDPTGEIPTVLLFGAGGGILGGIAGFAGSALDQLSSGDGFSLRRALGSAANGMVTGAVKGALIGSGVGIPVAFGADFAAGAAGNLLEQAISGERVTAGRGILGGLSNAVSGAIFGNVPFKNAGEAFGKGALAGAATSGLGYLSDLIGRQPKSGQMRHFPGGAVARTPYERLMDPRGICILQDIFGGGLGVRKAYGYRYEMRDPDQPVRDGFDLGDFLRSTLTGGLMGGLSGVAFFGVGKAVEALKGSLNRGSKGGTGHGYLVDSTMFPDDEAAGVLGNREYVKNPTAHNINDYISEGSNYLGSKNINGQYMYVVDMDGNIIIGTRGGQRMPHPTLVGGGNPQVQAAGIVEIRGGKIYSINNASGHFKPSVESLGIAEDAFSNLQQNIFSQDFQGYLPYGE
jgi:hypothetical protein